MELDYLTQVLDIEAAALDSFVRTHPKLTPFFSHDFSQTTVAALREVYIRLLKVKADYVRYTVPMLRAAGEALRHGDDEDRAWSELFFGYAEDETDTKEDYGHHIWALNDMKALGAPESLLSAPSHESLAVYGNYFVEEAKLHPYAILGAKGVLEHLSIRISDDLVKGVCASGIEHAQDAVSFFDHHGILDLGHVAAGDKNLERIRNPQKRSQILHGTYFTSGSYRAFVHFGV